GWAAAGAGRETKTQGPERAAQGVARRETRETQEGQAMKSAEGRGRTLDEAVDAARIQLAESRRNVDVKVLSENPDETVVEVTVIGAGAPGSPAERAAAGAGVAVGADSSRSQADNAREIVDQLL